MPKGNKQATGRPRKPSKSKRVNLDDRLVYVVENSLKGTTTSLELGARIIQYLAKQAAIGDEAAIELLAHFGVEAKVTEVEPIVVYKPNGEISAWIV